MDNFAEALAAIRDLKDSGVVSNYAIGGAMGLAFWTEPIPTYDLDVFVEFHSKGLVTSLTPIYEWARQRGYEVSAEHIVMAGIPVQILPAHNQLAEQAIDTAVDLPYDDETARVIRPEYLTAMFLDGSARTDKRLARVAMLLESGKVDRELLRQILERYKLKLPQFNDEGRQ